MSNQLTVKQDKQEFSTWGVIIFILAILIIADCFGYVWKTNCASGRFNQRICEYLEYPYNTTNEGELHA